MITITISIQMGIKNENFLTRKNKIVVEEKQKHASGELLNQFSKMLMVLICI